MTHSIRHALVVMPLGLILSGCAGPQRSESSFDRETGPSARASARPAAFFERSNAPAGSAATDTQHNITLNQIRDHVRDNTAVVIDARTADQFARGHVRGAMNVPAGEVASHMPQIKQTVDRKQFIIIYCNGPSCGSGDMVYDYLTTQGYTNMRVYSPGWLTLASAKNLH